MLISEIITFLQKNEFSYIESESVYRKEFRPTGFLFLIMTYDIKENKFFICNGRQFPFESVPYLDWDRVSLEEFIRTHDRIFQ